MKTTKLFLLLLLALTLQAQAAVPDSIYPPANLDIPYHTAWTKTHYPERIQQFKTNPLENSDIVFLGNSLTELGGNWGSRFNNSTVKNRGIAGDVTEGVLARLGEIYYFKPTAVFLLIGINDIFANKTPEFIAANIALIATKIHQRTPDTKVYVQTILPTATQSIVTKISETNTLLVNNATAANYTVVNLHPLFATASDIMKAEYTTDGTHLTEAGYAVWVNEIDALIPSNLSGNLLKNADLQNGTASWVMTGTANMFKIDLWSPSQPALKSFANNYWQPTYPVDGSITQTVTDIPNGKYIFSCQFAGASPKATSYSALIATDGNNVVTKKEFTMPTTWSVISMPIDVTGGQVTVGFTIKDDVNSVFWFDASDFKLQSSTQTAIHKTSMDAYFSAISNYNSNQITVRFRLANTENKVTINIYNITGGLVHSYNKNLALANEDYSFIFNKNNIQNSQIYIAQLITSNNFYSHKFVL